MTGWFIASWLLLLLCIGLNSKTCSFGNFGRGVVVPGRRLIELLSGDFRFCLPELAGLGGVGLCGWV